MCATFRPQVPHLPQFWPMDPLLPGAVQAWVVTAWQLKISLGMCTAFRPQMAHSLQSWPTDRSLPGAIQSWEETVCLTFSQCILDSPLTHIGMFAPFQKRDFVQNDHHFKWYSPWYFPCFSHGISTFRQLAIPSQLSSRARGGIRDGHRLPFGHLLLRSGHHPQTRGVRAKNAGRGWWKVERFNDGKRWENDRKYGKTWELMVKNGWEWKNITSKNGWIMDTVLGIRSGNLLHTYGLWTDISFIGDVIDLPLKNGDLP